MDTEDTEVQPWLEHLARHLGGQGLQGMERLDRSLLPFPSWFLHFAAILAGESKLQAGSVHPLCDGEKLAVPSPTLPNSVSCPDTAAGGPASTAGSTPSSY